MEEIEKSEKSDTKSELKDKEDNSIFPDEILENLPQSARKTMTQFLAMSLHSSESNPLIKKLNPEHIGKIIEGVNKDEDNRFSFHKRKQWFNMFYFVVLVIVFLILVMFLRTNDKELLTEIFKIIVYGAGGFGVGYGYKSYKDK